MPSLVILPTLNEEAGLAATLDDLERVRTFSGPSPAVLVVDGRSTDRTVEVARLRGVPVLRQTGRGKGAAVREALRWARDRGFGTVAVLDADGTYPCDRLPTLFQLLQDGAEVVIGVRRPSRPAHATARDFVHRLGNGALNVCAAHLSGGPILDVCSGFWGTHLDVAESLHLESDGFEVESELFVKSFRQGLRVVQIPVEYRERIGQAKLHAARDGARIFLSIVRNARDTSRVTGTYLLPLHRPERPARPDPGTSRTLVSVVRAMEASSVVVFSAPSRSAEAANLARSLSTTQIDVQVWPLKERPEGPEGAGTGADRPLHAPAFPARSVQVALPDPSWPTPEGGVAVVEAPRSRTLFLLGVSPGALPVPIGVPASPRRRSSGAFQILGAIFDPSGAQKERTMVTANGGGLPVALRRGSPMERRWSRAIGPMRPAAG